MYWRSKARSQVLPKPIRRAFAVPEIATRRYLGMQVTRDFRRRGYGAALLGAVVDHCREAGFACIQLTVLKSNSAARSLYDKVGFVWLEDLPPCTLASRVADQPERMRLPLDSTKNNGVIE
ncbi:GNAT family N-acetyltransferase [Pseudomonas capeferrum]|uniref:GNAT family N-acetyltransferase n=1 Tax=Pseudomonas capeferrum TaxID=1495066 RepID=UPI0015E40C32|nr:GNAT family N-acetyltransferase [Pseudomonas capeferrum]MBA1203257.1 GNAT family N-acetyltransferase [Pseudomonas capeferrum]